MKRIRVFLDNSMEVAIAVGRAYALAALLGAVASFVAYVWTGDTRWVTTGVILLVTDLAAGYVSFWLLGNPEWRRGAPND